jgi:hypothetical protein
MYMIRIRNVDDEMTPTVDYPNNTCETPHHRNLKTTISSLYGRETWNNFRLLENLRIKIVRRAVDLDFLKKCRDNNLTPIFSLISHQIRSRWNYKAFERLSRALVRGELRKTRAALDALSKNALKLHLQLAHKIRMDLWTVMDASAALKADGERRKAIERHTRKLRNLTAKRDAAGNRNNTADNTKMMEHLTTTGSYKKLDNNPISKVIKEVKKAIKVSNLDEWMKK